MVLTRFSLDYPDEVFDFFAAHGINRVAFNIDELIGTRTASTYNSCDAIASYRQFVSRFLDLTQASQGKLQVREFRQVYQQILDTRKPDKSEIVNSTNRPMRILNFDYRGNYWTFSPELSGAKSSRYHDFIMGNVLADPIDCIFENPVFQLVNSDIQEGIDLCRRSCQYWDVCGGGSPATKFFEHGRFSVSETLTCRVQTQMLTDVILDHLEGHLFNETKEHDHV